MARSCENFQQFVDSSPSPFHAVAEISSKLESQNFVQLFEREDWLGKIQKNGKYYFKRNESSIFAFVVGGNWKKGNGFSIVGAHTDSPCLKLKPISKKTKSGYLEVGVQTYGGGLWHTWFDRDLGVAGRVVFSRNGKLEQKNVLINEPILRIPTLAIHLDRGVNTDGFKFNLETQLQPVLGLASSVEGDGASAHDPLLMEKIAAEAKCAPKDIMDVELCLFHTQPATVAGINGEFLLSARLDNLVMSFCATEALVDSLETASQDSQIRVLALFDNEEIGSQSAYGADSLLLEATFRRILGALAEKSSDIAFEQAMANSFLISADMAHALHPNYPEKHEENHRPQMNKGTVIKINANQRYATTAVTSSLLKKVALAANVPVQEFVVRNDSPCGSTIGPMLSAHLGMRTIDIGNPQLSMHSIREQCGVKDFDYAIKLLSAFYSQFKDVDSSSLV